jgi:hypothetical protein
VASPGVSTQQQPQAGRTWLQGLQPPFPTAQHQYWGCRDFQLCQQLFTDGLSNFAVIWVICYLGFVKSF